MRQTSLSVSLLLVLFVSASFGDTYNPEIKRGPFVGDLKIGRDMVAEGHRLWGCEIIGQDLRDSSFDDCELGGVVFRQCDLRGVTFRRAVMASMTVDDCEWGNNDFTDAVINGIVRQFDDDKTGITSDSLLSTWSFKNKDLSNCYIPTENGNGYDFSQFNLSKAILDGVRKASLAKSKLNGVTFRGCDLTKFDFTDTYLHNGLIKTSKVDYQQLKRGCRSLTGTSFHSVEFQGALDFSNKEFGSIQLIAGNTEVANLTNANVRGVETSLLNRKNITETKSYRTGDLRDMTIYNCDFSGVDFSRQLLINTEFSECNFEGCIFDDAVVTNTRFQDCVGLTQAQLSSTWNSKERIRPGAIVYSLSLPKEPNSR